MRVMRVRRVVRLKVDALRKVLGVRWLGFEVPRGGRGRGLAMWLKSRALLNAWSWAELTLVR